MVVERGQRGGVSGTDHDRQGADPTDRQQRFGAVLTGRVTDFLGDRSVAYFLTTIEVGPDEEAVMVCKSISE